jgi:hypothetical protein
MGRFHFFHFSYNSKTNLANWSLLSNFYNNNELLIIFESIIKNLNKQDNEIHPPTSIIPRVTFKSKQIRPTLPNKTLRSIQV